jgi:hypothetical protein
MKSSTLIALAVIGYLVFRHGSASAKPKAAPPKPPPGKTGVPETAPRNPAFGSVPPGFNRKFYYGTHWVYEYPQNPPEHRFWLSFFSGAQGWSNNENTLSAS